VTRLRDTLKDSPRACLIRRHGIVILTQTFGPVRLLASDGHEMATMGSRKVTT
jgi:hypothetical protein